jgi:hypothetical protein
MEDKMATDDFGVRPAMQILEEQLIQEARAYEDAKRHGDEQSASEALLAYTDKKRQWDALTGSGQQQQQQSGQLTVAQRNFLSRRAAGGDQLDGKRMADYARAHDKALAAGLQQDTPEYFTAVESYVDHLGDGRQPPLNEREVAKMCGIDEETYAQGAEKLRALKASGLYKE